MSERIEDQPRTWHDFEESEYPIPSTKIKEVINPSTEYFGELIVATHKAYAIGVAWYKGRMSSGEGVWFKSSELECVD